jgi:hypothetical protein
MLFGKAPCSAGRMKHWRVCYLGLPPRSTLEHWIIVGLKLGHNLPVLARTDLNKVQHGRLATT